MSFQFPKGARDFFKGIEKQREGATRVIMFDKYYCCLLAGLDVREVASKEDLEGEVFVNAYPEDYRGQADIIAGLLIDAELDRKAIAAGDRSSIELEIVNLLDPSSPTKLSAAGNDLLNLYAAKGFGLIRDRMLPPAGIEDFLVAYHGYWHGKTDT